MMKSMSIVALLSLLMVIAGIATGLRGEWDRCNNYIQCEPEMSCVSSNADFIPTPCVSPFNQLITFLFLLNT